VYDVREQKMPDIGMPMSMLDAETGETQLITGFKTVHSITRNYNERLELFQEHSSKSGSGVVNTGLMKVVTVNY
jgi:hypothetical protein